MKICDYIARFIDNRKSGIVFGVTGGMIAFMVDSIYRRGKTRFIPMHHEQAAAFAAEAYGRMTGKPGVAMATSGPGATNLITGIGSCYFDSSAAVFITGQVRNEDFKDKKKIRQQGFQETDIVSVVKPVVKASYMTNKPDDVPAALKTAFWLANEGRPGPVLVDIPIDVQQADMKSGKPVLLRTEIGYPTGLEKFIGEMYKKLSQAERPLILIGGGIRASKARDIFLEWLSAIDMPVVHSLMAVDVLPFKHLNRVGMIGSYGNRYANIAVKESDLLLVLGSRLDNRQTGSDPREFGRGKEIFQIDCDKNQLNNRVKGCKAFCCDLKIFLNSAVKNLKEPGNTNIDNWKQRIRNLKEMYPDTQELSCRNDSINPNQLMHMISCSSRHASGYAVDVGQHQMWAAQSMELNTKQRFLTSGGMGSMGFGLPAAIGMAFSSPDKPVVLIAGDGGFQMNIQELETIKRNRLPLKMIIINNHCLGMVRQFQDEFFKKRYVATHWGYTAPDFEKISRAYGIPAKTVKRSSGVKNALKWLWRDPLSPALIQVDIPVFLNVHPKIKFGSYGYKK